MQTPNKPKLRTAIASDNFEFRRRRIELQSQTWNDALPPGFDLHFWQHALLLKKVIESGWGKGRISADLASCTMSAHACFKEVFSLKPAQLYREYRTSVSDGNNRPGNPNKLPLKTFDRRVVEQLVAWFPGLVEIASNQQTARNA